jgi:hypothetical protein
MASDREYFELRRRIDDLIYQFDRKETKPGIFGYQRRDKDLWINWHPLFGWVAWDGESDVIGGRPWYTLPSDQQDFPPEGVWVSMKNEKSYVYDLVYPKGMEIKEE